MDIKLETEKFKFKYRVNGIIIYDNKVLIVKMNNNDYFCLPRGHVELGEISSDGVIREMKEETGYDTDIISLLCISENLFKTSKNMHELSFYYLLKPKNKIEIKDNLIFENDKDKIVKLDFKWITMEQLKDMPFRPFKIKEKLIKGNYNLEHIVINEL